MAARRDSEEFSIVIQNLLLEVPGLMLGVLTPAAGVIGGIYMLTSGVGIATIINNRHHC